MDLAPTSHLTHLVSILNMKWFNAVCLCNTPRENAELLKVTAYSLICQKTEIYKSSLFGYCVLHSILFSNTMKSAASVV